ncbi:MAG TPA: hypothetical protein VHB68_03210 [Steroidobacteraceae bacterium]|nr:hypothetical protein [Steroidobacteraceae bacterium]
MIDLLPRFLFPARRRGLLWLKEKVHELHITTPLAPGCLKEFVASAVKAAPTQRSKGESYAASLRKQINARAQFILLWTTTDDALTDPQWSEWVDIARRYLLPRSWKIPETTATEQRRDHSFAVPERLIVKAPHPSNQPPRPLTSAEDLPGTQILSDLRRANKKS